MQLNDAHANSCTLMVHSVVWYIVISGWNPHLKLLSCKRFTMSKVVVEDIQKARKLHRGKQIKLYIENQALSKNLANLNPRKHGFVPICAVSALELHTLSRYPSNRHTEWQNDRNTNRLPYAFAAHAHWGIMRIQHHLQYSPKFLWWLLTHNSHLVWWLLKRRGLLRQLGVWRLQGVEHPLQTLYWGSNRSSWYMCTCERWYSQNWTSWTICYVQAMYKYGCFSLGWVVWVEILQVAHQLIAS